MNKPTLKNGAMALAIVMMGSLCAWILLGMPTTGIDDADIFFVYARHLAEGHGFVYNLGGERVEGFTSMLWTLLCSGFFRVTRQVEIPLYLFNVVLGMATVWLCLRRTRSPVLFMVFLFAVPAWFAWCQVTLMETGLWCLLLTLSCLSVVERRVFALAALMPLLVLTRPESMLWGGWLALMLGLSVFLKDGWRTGLRTAALPALVFLCSMLGLVAYRQAYFGYPVPNTYYAKVSPSLLTNLWNGTGYLLRYLLSNPVVTLAVVTMVLILIRNLRRWRAGLDDSTWLALCILPGIGIPMVVGGDHFGGFRFFESLWPLLCLLAANAWARRWAAVSPAKGRTLLVALVLCGWMIFPFTVKLKHEFLIAQEGRETGRTLSVMFDDWDALPRVATITAGGSKYTYRGTVLDLMGLNATKMAHAPGPRTGFKNHTAFNREVFYGWAPDILLCGGSAAFDSLVLKGLFDDERFKRQYIKLTLRRNGRELNAYYSHAFLEQVHGADR